MAVGVIPSPLELSTLEAPVVGGSSSFWVLCQVAASGFQIRSRTVVFGVEPLAPSLLIRLCSGRPSMKTFAFSTKSHNFVAD